MSKLLLGLLVIASWSECGAIFFKLKQGQQKCFLEIFRKDEVVIITYRSPDQNKLPLEQERLPYHAGPKLLVKEATGKVVFEGQCDQEGRFAFTAQSDLEHSICWSVEGHSLGQEFRIHLDIKQGSPSEDVKDMAKVEHLGAMELKVRKLNDEITRIKREQEYFKQREARFRDTVESTNFRSQWFSVAQIVGMGVVTALHLSYLSHYFVKKKII